MGPEISPAPLDSPTKGESLPSPAQSPQLTDPGSGLNPPWLDSMSPNSAASPIFDDKRASLVGLLSSDRAENAITGLGLYDSSQEKPPGPLKMFLKSFQKFTRSRWSMVLFLLLGIGGAVSHLCLYAHLEGEVAEDQDWWLGFGQLISFLSKSSFVFAMLMAQQQTAWRAVGKKDYTVHGVNSLFGSSHDIMELLSIEAWRKSFLAMMLSLCIRFSPLIIIISSPTLSVSPGVAEDRDARCQSVRTLNFSQESHNEWDNPKRFESDNLIGIYLSNWEITGERGDNDTIEYWALPSTQFEGLANRVFTANQAIQRDNVAEEVCGSGCDCSTVIHFIGPGYKCESVTPKSGILIDDFAGVKAPFNMTKLAPEGNHTYFTRTIEGDYGDQIALKDGKPAQPPPYPASLGAFKAEPMIWLGYTTVEDINKTQPKHKGAPGWDEAFTPAVLACEHYVANYTVNLIYTGGLQTYNITHRDYLHKVVNTTYQETLNVSTDGLMTGVVAIPEENYILPFKENIDEYRLIATYHSLGKVLRDMMNGEIKLPKHITKSNVLSSKLIDKHDYIAIPNLEEEVRRLYEDLLISLLSNPQMLAVTWAGNDSESSGTLPGGPQYPCHRHRLVNKSVYQREDLLAVYATAAAIALIGVISGIKAMDKDRVREQREMTFSSIAEATKKLQLDQHTDMEKKIMCVHVGDSPAGRVFEFEPQGGREQDNSSKSALNVKPGLMARETAV